MSERLERFLAEAEAARSLVATDFDGTLSSIVAVPSQAVPLPGALEALSALTRSVLAAAIISGRSPGDLERLLPIPGLRRLGDYGRPAPSPAERQGLAAFNAAAGDAVARLAGVRVEAKPGSTSVHFRDRPGAEGELAAALEPLARAHHLDLRRGRLVFEVVPQGWDKARALRALVDELEPAAVLFAGDDHGDRGCFTYLSTLERPHLAIGVRSPETPDEVFAACDLVVDGPEAMVEVLSRLAAEWGRPGRDRAGRAPGG